MERKQFPEAADQMRQCLSKRTRPALSPVNREIRKAGPRHCLARCLARSGDVAGASREFLLAREEDPESAALIVDHARFLDEQGSPVEALQTLHRLTTEKPALTTAWQAGGAIALRQPQFLEVAADWTAEAVRHHPKDESLRDQRAYALLLSGHPDEALPLWRSLAEAGQPPALAAALLCEAAGQGPLGAIPAPLSASVTQEFFRVYRLLLDFGAETVVLRVNGRVQELATVLPRAAHLLQTVIDQAVGTPVPH